MKSQLLYSLIIVASLSFSACRQGESKKQDNKPAVTHENMVLIPSGEFTMGTDDENSMANERPSHKVKVENFWIDKYDVTNAEFRKFVEATGYVTTAERPIDWNEIKKQLPPDTPKPDDALLQPGSLVYTPPQSKVDLNDLSGWWTWTPGANWKHPQGPESNIDGKDSYPVVQVSWEDAMAYAKWAKKRLPTEAEWEYASRGKSENTRYYWGNEFLNDGKYMANTYTGDFPYNNTAADGYAGLAPVGSFPANGYGLYDMAGNVWNWTADVYIAENHAQTCAMNCDMTNENPISTTANTTNEARRVTKGGSFLCNPSYCESYRPTARRGTPYDTGMGHIGFRCVQDI